MAIKQKKELNKTIPLELIEFEEILSAAAAGTLVGIFFSLIFRRLIGFAIAAKK